MSAIHELPLIDIDAHFTEPADLWTARAPAGLRDVAPRVVRKPDGSEAWIVDRDFELSPPGFCVIRPDGSKAMGMFSLPRLEEMTPAASEPLARVRALDELGIARQILYPNVLGFAGGSMMRIQDRALRDFCVQAYNDAAAEIQRVSGGRLLPQAMLPFWEPREAARELARCHDRLGLTGFTMTDSPETWGLPSLVDPVWDPLFSTAQERRLPVNFHIGSGDPSGALWPGIGLPRNIGAVSTILFIANARCIVNLIFSGLLDRYPTLNFVSVESGLGWLPFVLESAEYQVAENGIALELRPREYFRRQIYASFWFESEDVAHAIKKLGADNVMIETDFPHPTCLYPGARKKIEEVLAPLPEADQRKMFYGNAARVYNLELNV
jgi:predicted TIM-barrel fold metal-dependent hydrolase